jgi:hypothetical protein
MVSRYVGQVGKHSPHRMHWLYTDAGGWSAPLKPDVGTGSIIQASFRPE